MNRSFVVKKITIILASLLLVFSALPSLHAQALKWIAVGKFHDKIKSNGDQAQSEAYIGYYYFDDFVENTFETTGQHMLTRDWEDSSGAIHAIWGAGGGHAGVSPTQNWMPVPQEDGLTIHKYYRQQPPSSVVDGVHLEEPFPLEGESVAPEKIPGTADVMVESWFNTMMGVTIHQRVLGWDETNHDDYHMYIWTFINTGNTDLDPDIELPNQTVKDFYYSREAHYGHTWHSEMWWTSAYGEFPGDSLRMTYYYPARTRGSDYDNAGDPNPGTGYLRMPWAAGDAFVHVDTAPGDTTDWVEQPQATGVYDQDLPYDKLQIYEITDDQRQQLWDLLVEGTTHVGMNMYPSPPALTPRHEIRTDEAGLQYPNDVSWWTARAVSMSSFGPWTLAPHDSVTIVYARGMGSISPEKAWDVGTAWLDGDAASTWQGAFKLRPQYTAHPDLTSDDNDKAKDSWVFTSIDSLHRNLYNAQWNARHNYNVPSAPPAPSIEVQSLPDKIVVKWDDVAESAGDFAGYRVYRASGNPGPTVQENQLIGQWERVFACGAGTGNSLTHEYEDDAAKRGVAYYYYVTAFDDGTSNDPGVFGTKEVLESGRYRNRTTRAAHLTRPPGELLSEIRVVPNPFNISAQEIQFVGEPHKILFVNLPPQCTIRIYTSSGDLVKTLEHTDGSGDEAWGNLPENHMVSETGQLVVSGVYVAHVETPEGESHIVKFAIVR